MVFSFLGSWRSASFSPGGFIVAFMGGSFRRALVSRSSIAGLFAVFRIWFPGWLGSVCWLWSSPRWLLASGWWGVFPAWLVLVWWWVPPGGLMAACWVLFPGWLVAVWRWWFSSAWWCVFSCWLMLPCGWAAPGVRWWAGWWWVPSGWVVSLCYWRSAPWWLFWCWCARWLVVGGWSSAPGWFLFVCRRWMLLLIVFFSGWVSVVISVCLWWLYTASFRFWVVSFLLLWSFAFSCLVLASWFRLWLVGGFFLVGFIPCVGWWVAGGWLGLLFSDCYCALEGGFSCFFLFSFRFRVHRDVRRAIVV